MMPDTMLPRHIGGRLDAEREQALLDVTLVLLAEVGYERMSLDEVARRAHASKATLYRRWSSKAELVAAAILGHKLAARKPPPGVTLREDLMAEAGCLCQESTAARALAEGLLTAMRTDPYLAELIRRQTNGPMQQEIAGIIAHAVERGELPSGCAASAATLTEVMQALIGTRMLFSGRPLDVSFIEYLVDEILLPIVRGGSPASTVGIG
jgi:AcrR family transcriptional regulator